MNAVRDAAIIAAATRPEEERTTARNSMLGLSQDNIDDLGSYFLEHRAPGSRRT